ncbi:MAG: FAD-dependent oxidoreductase [Candidatus Bathyarchaeota archaeon]|nr:FAD-dependent oxidoreductase [Candidatus Bathyarchaeota archaeon]
MVIIMECLDLIIIGAGPAGLAAGLYGVRSGLKTLILEEKVPGGEVLNTPFVENYLGFKRIRGRDLAEKMVEHSKRAGVRINELEKVVELDLGKRKKVVKTDRNVYGASAVLVASGSHYKSLGVSGEKEFRGRGVSYCTLCDGAFFRGGNVLVVGGGDSAVVSARYLANIASRVRLAHRRDQLRAERTLVKDLIAQGVEIMWNTELKEVKGDAKVKGAVLLNNKTGETSEIDVDGVFVQVGEAPNSQIAEKAGIEVDNAGYVIVDSRQRTNIAGVFAAGNVTTGSVKQIGTAVGEAIVAANEAFGYVKKPYYYCV